MPVCPYNNGPGYKSHQGNTDAFDIRTQDYSKIRQNTKYPDYNKYSQQAGAELCQAQDKLGLAKPDLPITKLRSFSFIKFQLKTK